MTKLYNRNRSDSDAKIAKQSPASPQGRNDGWIDTGWRDDSERGREKEG